MHSMGTRLPVSVTIGLGLVMFAAACGTNATAGSAPAAAPSGAATVAARTVNGASVLVDQAGATLYTNDQDKAGKSQCVSSDCTKIWVPLTLSSGTQPTAGPGVGGTVATVQRPDGTSQVTLDGKPLYTFSFDNNPGKVTGNGAQDSFAGTAFTWHSASTGGQATAPAAPPANGNPGGY
jgi:predicted lipoprotein with Yx(FWY)xxD motif